MPTEVSKICASSARASTNTCLTLSSVRSNGGGDERAAAEAGNLIRLVVDFRGRATMSILLPSIRRLRPSRWSPILDVEKALVERIDGSLTDNTPC